MNNATNRYLDLLSQRYPWEGRPATDYRLAKILGIAHTAVSRYRVHGGGFDNKTCLKVAELLGIEPLEVIAAIEKDRAKNDSDRDFWGGQLRRMGVAAGLGLCIVHTAFFSGDARASTLSERFEPSHGNIHYATFARLRRWLRRRLAHLDGPIGLFTPAAA